MIFSELYSAYYNAVSGILKFAIKQPLKPDEIRSIIEKYAFGESILNIEPALTEERWQLLRSDGSTPLAHSPTMPLTTLQKRWLKAIYEDPRIKLFTDEENPYPEVEPLFTAADYCVFDKYSDGDPYEDSQYIQTFRLILDAIENQYPLSIDTANRKDSVTHIVLLPKWLEYSEKDDKFRVVGTGYRYGGTVNLARIISCKPFTKPRDIQLGRKKQPRECEVEFELLDQRNALERVLLHFAHFKKQVEKIEDKRYRVVISYSQEDETEIVIRILSFGPMIKVTSPYRFIRLIRKRLLAQKSCEH